MVGKNVKSKLKNCLLFLALFLISANGFCDLISTIIDTSVQSDGRIRVSELHRDIFGGKYYQQYLANANDDINAILLVHGASIFNDLIINELGTDVSNISDRDISDLTFKFCTQTQFLQAIRNEYQNANQVRALRIANYFNNLIINGQISDTQIRNFFGIGAGQVAALKTFLANQAALYASVIASVGQ